MNYFDLDLAEYSLGIEDGTIIDDFKADFNVYWEDAGKLLSVAPGQPVSPTVQQASAGDIVVLEEGVHEISSTLAVPEGVALFGYDATLNPSPSMAGQPLLRVAGNNVHIEGIVIQDSPGYGIEIGDGITAFENVSVSGVVFVNNALGGIHIQSPANGSAVSYTVENNTFVGDDYGITISANANSNGVIRNNIFAGQNIVPIQITSANDGTVDYGYNLFYDCGGSSCAPGNWKSGNLGANSSEHNNLFDLDPLFANPANGDYTLSLGSPAVDAGDPAIIHEFLFDGNADGIPGSDIGAFEYTDFETPTVQSITRASANPTRAASVDFAVMFSEPVTGVDAGDFVLSTTGTAAASIGNVSGSGAVYTVTVNIGLGSGTIRLDVPATATILDGVSNSLSSEYISGEIYTVEELPSVLSIIRTSTNPTKAASVNFLVTFSGTINNVYTSDFTLTTTGVSGASISNVTGSGAQYTVSVNTGSGSGTIRLDVDKVGYTSGEVYTIDKTLPSVQSISRLGTNPTNAASVTFNVVFSEAVTGVDTGDFSLTVSGITGASVSSVSGSGNQYSVTVSTGSGSGSIRLDALNNGSIIDLALNSLNSGFTSGESYTIDKTPPVLQSISRASGTPTNAASVSFTLVFSEAINIAGLNTSDFSVSAPGLSGWYISAVNIVGPANVFNVTIYTGTGSGSIRLDMINDGTVKDMVGNTLSLSGTYTGPTYVIDKTNPLVQSSTRSSLNPTQLTSVPFTVVFSESVTGVDTAEFNLTVSGISGAYVSSVSGSGNTYTVYAATGTGSGTLRLNVVNNGTIIDATGNPLGGSYTSGQTYNVRTTTFTDVPVSHWAWQFIERVYSAGIMGGCSSGIFCPESNLLRDQMAVVLLRGIHGAGYVPPAVGGSTGFNDVPVGYWAAAWIKQLAAEGITGGCGGGNYCPTSPVTRAQMAVFLLRSKYGAAYVPPAATGAYFTDVPAGYWAAAWIEQLVREGIASGCTASAYCPESSLTRAQAAVFLVRTFNLP